MSTTPHIIGGWGGGSLASCGTKALSNVPRVAMSPLRISMSVWMSQYIIIYSSSSYWAKSSNVLCDVCRSLRQYKTATKHPGIILIVILRTRALIIGARFNEDFFKNPI